MWVMKNCHQSSDDDDTEQNPFYNWRAEHLHREEFIAVRM